MTTKLCCICHKPVGDIEDEYKNSGVSHVACAMESIGISDFYKKEYKVACLCRKRQISSGKVK